MLFSIKGTFTSQIFANIDEYLFFENKSNTYPHTCTLFLSKNILPAPVEYNAMCHSYGMIDTIHLVCVPKRLAKLLSENDKTKKKRNNKTKENVNS